MRPAHLRAAAAAIVLVGGLTAAIVLGGSSDSPGPVAVEQAAAAASRPTVAITRPAAGATVSGAIPVVARVSRNPVVSRVEFRVDGRLRWTDRVRPYVMFGNAGRLQTSSLKTGRHRLTVTAIAVNGSRRSASRVIRVKRGAGGGVGNPGPPAPSPGLPALSPGLLGLRVASATTTTISLAWNAVPGASAYGVHVNGRKLTDVAATGYTLANLSCGIAYQVQIDAVGANGTRTAKVALRASTQPCEPASFFLSPSGSDGNPCSAAAPCRTLDRGYKVAAPGQVVELSAGSYPGGNITNDPSKNGAAARVVLRGAANAAVSVSDELFIRAQHLELRDMSTPNGWQTNENAADVTVRNVDSKHLFIFSSQNVEVIGGSIGPGVDYHPIIGASTSTPPRGILIEGVRFHDWTRSNASVHTECLQVGAGDGIVIRGNTFTNCAATGNLHLAWFGPAPPTRDVTVENNFFSTTVGGFYSVQAEVNDTMLIRNNSATQGILVNMKNGAPRNVRVIANLAPMGNWECVSGVQYSYNVWFYADQTPAKCSATDLGVRTGNPGFVNAGALDLHITAASPANGRGSAADGAATDIDGEVRDLSAAPDAGADER